MILTIFTIVHVLISLVGIVAGFVVVWGFLTVQRLQGWTKIFLVTTIATSVTGFMFPFHGFKPSYVVGLLSLIVLTACILAVYRRHLAGHWRLIYVVTAIIAFYFNFFVLIVQSFMKIPALHDLAPTQTEQPFKLTQLVVLMIFVALGIASAIRFHPERALAA